MSDDYYSYKPLYRLSRPLVVCGLPGTSVGRTVRAINLLTGLSFVWLDRRVEHEVGMSVELLHTKEGREARLAAELRVLQRIDTNAAPPVIALSDITLTDPEVSATLLATSDVVALQLQIAEAAGVVRADSEADPRKHYALLHEVRYGDQTLEEALASLAAAHGRVARRIEVAGLTPMQVAEQVVSRFIQRPT